MKGFIACLALLVASFAGGQSLVVGSKKFTESYVLGDIAKKQLELAGFKVDNKEGIGSTAIVWAALTQGQIDVYPEYTGTITEEILKKPGLTTEQIQAALAPFHVYMSSELGFNDAYGLVMRTAEAKKLGITKISDLRAHPELKCGITHELLDRKDDGWIPLTQRYGLSFSDTRAIDHGLGYTALASGQTDVKDCYTTDAEIKKYDLTVLQDDLHFFPLYRAVYLYRDSLPPKAVAALNSMTGTIPDPLMIAMNFNATSSKDYSKAAEMYFQSLGQKNVHIVSESIAVKILRLTGQHLVLVATSLALAILVGLPLGIRASRPDRLSAFILGGAGVIQTIPSLALLGLLVPIPGFGIGPQTAIFALFLYSLLPIIRNTATGLQSIPSSLRESAEALGLPSAIRMKKVFLPIALPTILAGVKTSAVINVGTATIAGLIGAGGLGQQIISGVAVNDNKTILEGAIPAAVLALLVQFAFDLLDRAVVPRGLRIR